VDALRAGVSGHRAHGRAVTGVSLLRRLAVSLLVIAAALLALWLVLNMGG
jgi:hypothetical protein